MTTVDYMVIKDTITCNILTIILPHPNDSYIVGRDLDTPELIKPRSIGKTIRAWMKTELEKRRKEGK